MSVLSGDFAGVSPVFQACYGQVADYPGSMPTASAAHDPARSEFPGERLGLPEHGPRSVARLGRRLIALLADWWLAVLLADTFFPNPAPEDAAQIMLHQTVIAAVFVAHRLLVTYLFAGSIGQLVTGVRVVPLRGGYIGWWRPVVRTLLILIVVPALIVDQDQRGLHDRVAGTVLVRR